MKLAFDCSGCRHVPKDSVGLAKLGSIDGLVGGGTNGRELHTGGVSGGTGGFVDHDHGVDPHHGFPLQGPLTGSRQGWRLTSIGVRRGGLF